MGLFGNKRAQERQERQEFAANSLKKAEECRKDGRKAQAEMDALDARQKTSMFRDPSYRPVRRHFEQHIRAHEENARFHTESAEAATRPWWR